MRRGKDIRLAQIAVGGPCWCPANLVISSAGPPDGQAQFHKSGESDNAGSSILEATSALCWICPSSDTPVIGQVRGWHLAPSQVTASMQG